MKRTDAGKIFYPKGTTARDRGFVRCIINSVRDFVNEHNLTDITVACSGGLDSTTLLDICSKVETIYNKEFSFDAVHVDYGLRPEENIKEHEFLQQFTDKRNIALHIVSEHMSQKKSVQLIARNIRYRIFKDHLLSTNKQCVFTAHTASDDLETMLFRLSKEKYMRTYNFSNGQRVLYGMRQISIVKDCKVYRPLLNLKRADLERYASIFKLTWCEDSSNTTDKYTRNYIRHNIVPLCRTINPNF